MKKELTPGRRMIDSAKRALAFATGDSGHGCVVHVPEDIDVKAIREKIFLSQAEAQVRERTATIQSCRACAVRTQPTRLGKGM